MPDDSLAYLLSGVKKRDPFAERRSFAQKLIQQGSDTSPVQSPWQGVGRLAQALAGGFEGYMADADEKKAQTDYTSKLAAAMAEPDPVKQIGMLPPEIAGPAMAKLALARQAQQASQTGLKTGAGGFGAIYGAQPPPGGQSAPSGEFQPTLAGHESGNDPKAVNPQSGASGLFQFLPPAAADVRNARPDLNLPADHRTWNEDQQRSAETVLRQLNGQRLQGSGIPPTPGNLYLAHRVGPQGVQTLLNSSPDAPLSTIFPPEWIAQNPDMRTTVGQFVKMAEGRFPSGGQQPAPPPQTPGGPGLTINMTPQAQQIPQGDNTGMPPAPSPQVVNGPTMQAAPQAPAVPNVPRPQPSKERVEHYQRLIEAGQFGADPKTASSAARAALEAELDRDWAVQRDQAKMQYGQETEQFKDDRARSQPSRQEVEKLHTARTEAATIVSALTDFQREFQNAGTVDRFKSVAGATTPVNTAYNMAALLAKGEQLFNLGVLNGPDLDIIRRTLPDPSTFKGSVASSKDAESAVGKVIDLLQTRLAARERQLGLPVTDVRGAAKDLRETQPGGKPAAPAAGSFVGPDGRSVSMADIEETARNRGMDPQAVIQRLQLRPVQ